MDNSRRNADRAGFMRALSQAAAGWQAKVLQRSVQAQSSQSHQQPQGDGRGSDGEVSDPLDMTARCEWCSKQLPGRPRSDRKYCSLKCANASAYAFVAEERLQTRTGRLCQQCGHEVPDTMQASATFCSIRCRNRFHDALSRSQHRRNCVQCGREFGGREHQVYCGRGCRTRGFWSDGKIRRKLTRDRLDMLLGSPRQKRRYVQRLTPARLDKMFETVWWSE